MFMYFWIYFVKSMIHLLLTLKRIKFKISILSVPSIWLFQCSVSLCSVFKLNNKKVNTLVARELSGFTCTRSLTMNSKFFNTALGGLMRQPPAVLKFLVHC